MSPTMAIVSGLWCAACALAALWGSAVMHKRGWQHPLVFFIPGRRRVWFHRALSAGLAGVGVLLLADGLYRLLSSH